MIISDLQVRNADDNLESLVLPITNGGTASTNAADARDALGAAAASHKHTAADVTNGVFNVARIPVDSVLSDTSVNPVQNKVVQTALASKQNKLVAGSNITINPNTNVISATGTSSGAGDLSGIDSRLRSVEGSVSDLNNYFSLQDEASLMNQRVHLFENITNQFDNGTFSARVADESFDGLALGQYIQKNIKIDGITYSTSIFLCDANLFYADTKTFATINTPHIACVVKIPNLKKPWNKTQTSSTKGGYAGSTLRDYVQNTVIRALQSVLGEHMISHHVRLSNSVASDGKSNSSAWFSSSYGEIMSAAQCCGISPGSIYDVGEAYRQLALFRLVNLSVIFGNNQFWLRDVISAEGAASIIGQGNVGYYSAASNANVFPLILLK